MRSNKTLVILTPGFPKDETDTACLTYLQDFILSFSRLYPIVELKIITSQYPFKKGHYRWNNIAVYSAGGKNSKLLRGLTWLNILFQLYKQYKRSEILTIQSFWLTECAFIGQLFARIFKIKHVMCALGQDVKKENHYLKFLQLKKTNTVVISEAMAERLFLSRGYTVQTIIPLGINTGNFSEPIVNTRDIDIIGVGSLNTLKNYCLFVEIIAALKQDFPKIKALIIGDGPEMPLLINMIKENGLTNNLTLDGIKPHTEAITTMRRSKVLLHTSHYEGQSMVMMEALAAGLTVVSFNLGKLHEEKRKIICNTKEEMIVALKKLFVENQFDHRSLVLQTMDCTIHQFAKLYGIDLDEKLLQIVQI